MGAKRSKVQIKFRLPVALHRVLAETANGKGISISEALNRAASEYVGLHHCTAHRAVNCPDSMRLHDSNAYIPFGSFPKRAA